MTSSWMMLFVGLLLITSSIILCEAEHRNSLSETGDHFAHQCDDDDDIDENEHCVKYHPLHVSVMIEGDDEVKARQLAEQHGMKYIDKVGGKFGFGFLRFRLICCEVLGNSITVLALGFVKTYFRI